MKAAELGRDLRIIAACACISGAWLGACGSESGEGRGAEPEAGPSEGAGGGAGGATSESNSEPDPDAFAAAYAVMQDRCSECHKTGTQHTFIVDDSLESTLESAFAARAKIEMRVTAPEVPSDRMPPNGPLTAEQLSTIEAWLAAL
jgi:uncharacterized membrane protein